MVASRALVQVRSMTSILARAHYYV
jgi:hypothetical protein